MDFLLPEDKEKYTKLYNEVDKEHGKGDGALTIAEFEILLGKCGLPMPKFLVGRVFVETDLNEDWRISLEEFLQQIARIVEPFIDPPTWSKKKFEELDEDKDGLLSFEDTKEFLLKTLVGLDEDLTRTVFDSLDKDKDGKITQHQFSLVYIPFAVPNQYKMSLKEVAASSPIPVGEKIRQIFEDCDQDKDGMVSRKDLRGFRKSAFPEYTKEDFKILFDLYDEDSDGRISLGQFIFLYLEDVAPFQTGEFAGEHRESGVLIEEKIRRKFDESDADGDGFLTRDDVKRLILNTFPGVGEEELNIDFFSKFDINGDDKISLNEFTPMFLFHLRPECYYISDSEEDDDDDDNNGDDDGDFDELAKKMAEKREAREKKIRQQFEACDTNKDGLLTFDSLRSFLSEHLPGSDEEELRRCFHTWDSDKDGKINCFEFVAMFMDLIWVDSDDED